MSAMSNRARHYTRDVGAVFWVFGIALSLGNFGSYWLDASNGTILGMAVALLIITVAANVKDLYIMPAWLAVAVAIMSICAICIISTEGFLVPNQFNSYLFNSYLLVLTGVFLGIGTACFSALFFNDKPTQTGEIVYLHGSSRA